ncbi:hypothetical protein JOQ06_025593 [Pogonophryne albipinna]|uniref:Uncharacterized protein n=1 Tax=Pogonophryne albipinna TaxID=1090488 RepID=A0AAD6FEW3_9TELE|nr:hypothetical protein JOQ06_025593 [Pogonophryne albipinna]
MGKTKAATAEQKLGAKPAVEVKKKPVVKKAAKAKKTKVAENGSAKAERQVAGEVQTQPQDRAVNQIAMMLAIMGLSLSYYSAKQMTEKVHVQPAP